MNTLLNGTGWYPKLIRFFTYIRPINISIKVVFTNGNYKCYLHDTRTTIKPNEIVISRDMKYIKYINEKYYTKYKKEYTFN
jgi:hypothetical protein